MRANRGRAIAMASMLCVMQTQVACGGAVSAQMVAVTTPGIAVVGTAFRLDSDTPTRLPFVLPVWKQGPRGDADLVNEYPRWLARGAQRVSVYTGTRERPYYGILSLHKIPAKASGAKERSFSVQLPPQMFANCADGRVTVAYEVAETPTGERAYSWVLWVADHPI